MAATAITVTTIDRTAITPPAEVAMDVANGNVLNGNSGAQWIEVTNTGGSTYTITASQVNLQDGVASPGKQWSIPAAGKRRIGPFPVNVYGTSVALAPQNVALTCMGYQLSPS